MSKAFGAETGDSPDRQRIAAGVNLRRKSGRCRLRGNTVDKNEPNKNHANGVQNGISHVYKKDD
jgi:hypothetical protein